MRTTIDALDRLVTDGQRLTMVTAYDYTSARIVEGTSIPLILVGDSLGMVVQGHDSTLPVTVDDMIYHTRAVLRGCTRPLVVTDLPFLSYADEAQAVHAAGRIMVEGGAGSVKLEGGASVGPIVRRLVELGIPVMGHLGFTPQSQHQIGLKVQGKAAHHARTLIEDALALQEAGAWAVVLELIPAPLAAEITRRLRIPTIGIGAGPDCTGQVQVWHDVLGLYTDRVPRHAKRWARLADEASAALEAFASQVRDGGFPGPEHSARMDDDALADAVHGLLGR